jgi:hypothetical protein
VSRYVTNSCALPGDGVGEDFCDERFPGVLFESRVLLRQDVFAFEVLIRPPRLLVAIAGDGFAE